MSEKEALLISACLLGVECKYSGGHNAMAAEKIAALREKYRLIPVCPETAGGLPTPRDPSERRGGQHDDEQHRLQPLEYRRRFYLRQRHARSRRQHHRDVRHPAVRLEQRDDVQHDKYQLRARV